MTDLLATVIGSFGGLLLVVAYQAGLSRRAAWIDAGNLVGSACLLVNAAWFHAWPPAAVNAIWILIAGRALAARRLARA